MSAWSWSLPAGDSCPMIRADDESYICHGCYASINRYNMPNVLRSQHIRFEWTKDLMRSDPDLWVHTMRDAIASHVENDFFRVHDSGDFFHPNYVRMWYEVCESLPEIHFWFPTRCYPHSSSMSTLWMTNLRELASLPNVTVRPSALRWDEPSPQVSFLSKGSTAVLSERHDLGHLCPKTTQGGTCETNSCRTCWFDNEEVAYLVHGYMGRHDIPNAQTEKIQNTRRRIREETLASLTIGVTG